MFALFYHLDRSGRFVDCTLVDETSPGAPRAIGYVTFTSMQWADFRRALGENPNIRLVKDDRYAVTRGPAPSNVLTPYPGNNIMPPRQGVRSAR